jgi:hypothetical protein
MGSATVYAGYYSTSWTAALTDFTVSLWFCAQYVTPSGNSRIIDKSYSGGFWIGQNGSGTTDQWGGGIQQTSSPYGLFGSGFTMGQWWHLAMKRKGTTQTLYKNGYPIASQSCSGSSFDASPFYIFAPTSSTNNGYVGQLNALKIWDYALPDDLVGEDYAQEISGNPQIFNRISFMVPGVSAIVSGKVQRRHIGIPRTGTRIEPATGGAL